MSRCEGCRGGGGNWDCMGENDPETCNCENCTDNPNCPECGGEGLADDEGADQ